MPGPTIRFGTTCVVGKEIWTTAWAGPTVRFGQHSPRTNVYISDESAVLTAEVPGFDSEEIEISVLDKTLTLSGIRKSEETGETSRIRRQERINGDFSRSFELPFRVDVDAIQAKIINGVLNVELPRLPEEKPKKITVNAT